MTRTGISRVEVVVTLAIIAILLAVAIPAIQSGREIARHAACRDNLRQLGGALQSFQDTHGVYPPGRLGFWGIFYAMLPHLGMQSFYEEFEQLDHLRNGMNPEFKVLQRLPMPVLQCPTESSIPVSEDAATRTSYAGNQGTGMQRYGYNGMFRPRGGGPTDTFRTGPIGPEDVIDGLAHTVAIAEWLRGAPGTVPTDPLHVAWMTHKGLSEPAQLEEFAALCAAVPDDPMRYGWRRNGMLGGTWLAPHPMDTYYNHVLAPGSPSCTNHHAVQEGAYTANSLHAGGVNVLFADGHVRSVSRTIDLQAWRDIGSRVEHDLIFDLD